MRIRRFLWVFLLANAAVLSFSVIAVLRLPPSDQGRLEPRLLLAALAGASLGGLVVVVPTATWLTNRWRRSQSQVTSMARGLARGDMNVDAIAGVDWNDPLARALVRMRDRLQRQFVTIERQRRTLEALVAQLHEGVVVTDPSGRIFAVNPAAIRLLDLAMPREHTSFVGIPMEECILDHDAQQLLLPRAHRTSTTGIDAESRNRAGPNIERSQVTEANIRLDTPRGGVSLLARASDIVLPGFSLADDPPRTEPRSGRLLVLTDVTELSRVMQVRTDFVANASHELRTPVSAIKMAVETLQSIDLTEDAAPAKHFLDVIARHSERLEDLVKDLLDLSRIESPTTHFARVPIDLAAFLDDLRATFAFPLTDKELRWEVDVDSACGPFTANPYLLQMILSNLVDNAIKFTPNGGLIRITANVTADGTRITVTDTGVGITAEDQSRVFERFYQAERARTGTARGTGLGLAIVRHAVTAMSGTVTLSSKLGEGTQVAFTIPSGDPA